jgi:hypothetical protein
MGGLPAIDRALFCRTRRTPMPLRALETGFHCLDTMRFAKNLRNLTAVFLISLGGLTLGTAQDVEPSPAPPSPPTESKPLQTLRALYANLEIAVRDRDAKQDELRGAATPAETVDITNEINDLNATIAGLRSDMESVAAGVDIRQLSNDLGDSIKLDEEFHELVQPIIQELKRATAKPREIEKLRNAVAFHTLRRDLAEKALIHLRPPFRQFSSRRNCCSTSGPCGRASASCSTAFPGRSGASAFSPTWSTRSSKAEMCGFPFAT